MLRRAVALVVLIWVMGFFTFAVSLPIPNETDHADAVVVLTGGEGRIDRGLAVLRAHVGRIDDTRSAGMDDEALVERVRDELSVLLGRFATPTETLVQRWPDGLPQYYVGHARLVADAKAAADSLGVALCGIAYDGVGVPAGIGSGRRAAREALAMIEG